VKVVISDPSTGKSRQIETEAENLIGKKIGDIIDGNVLGLPGTLLKITGGSDSDGFPMRPDLEGTGRKKLLLASGPGYRPEKKGVKRRKLVRGNTISPEIAQVNCKIVRAGESVKKLFEEQDKEKQEEKTEG